MKKFVSLLLCLCMTAALIVLPAAAETAFTAGTYTATAKGNNGDVTVEVTFDEKSITGVTVKEHNETPGLSDPAIAQIPAQIVAGNTLAVDAVTGATVTSTAILTAVADCVKQAGGDPEAMKTAAADEEEIVKTEAAMDSDVLVIGGGIAGLTAAMKAADAGASVILIDKSSAVGGTTAISGGYLVAVESELYAGEAQSFDTLDSVMAYWTERMSYSGVENEYPDWERLRGVLSETGKTVDYLAQQGVPWDSTMTTFFGPYPVAHCEGNGAGLVASMLEICQNKGVTVLTGCKAEHLVVTDGAVTGAVAETADSVITFTAKSVVLTTGGISRNAELVAMYSPKIDKAQVIPTSAVSNTGDGLTMALEAGAGTFGTFATAICATTVDPELAALTDTSLLSTNAQLGVNAKGERFASEAAKYYDALASDMIQNGEAPFWYIYDAANADVAAVLEAGVESGVVAKGETIAELAAAMQVDAATLEATYARYAELVKAGEDSDFGKAASALVAIDQAPYYAVKFYPTTFGSVGGVMTTDEGRVLNANGDVISGLYAAGEMSNRYYYNENYILAASLGLYATTGSRAGVAAAQDALK